MKKTGMTMDFTDFDTKFIRFATKKFPHLVMDGERHAGQEIKLDADNVPPRTPHLEGMLRGSGKVLPPKETRKSIDITIVYDMPYATKWHEAETTSVNWSESGVGSKYLESKLTRFRNKYIAIIVKVIKMGMKR